MRRERGGCTRIWKMEDGDSWNEIEYVYVYKREREIKSSREGAGLG
jgi:hypothetical protein